MIHPAIDGFQQRCLRFLNVPRSVPTDETHAPELARRVSLPSRRARPYDPIRPPRRRPSLNRSLHMIIDCHGHYTTAPKALQDYRDSQIAGLKEPAHVPQKANVNISDDQIRESLEGAQLKLQRARGTDMTIFSPRASAMAHHIGNETTSLNWTIACNDLIHRVCGYILRTSSACVSSRNRQASLP
jgi:hypothetical protein